MHTKTIGYDSITVREKMLAEIDAHLAAAQKMVDQLQDDLMAMPLYQASAIPAHCSICNMYLGSFPDDTNHHAGYAEDNETVIHYCQDHCPACKDDDK